MPKELGDKLGIKSGSKVCLLRPGEEIIARIGRRDINLLVNQLEEECDVILYWMERPEYIREKMAFLMTKIKPDGRIWVIMPKKGTAKAKNLPVDWSEVQKEILKTKLVDNKVVSINEEEYGTQFVIRQKYR